MKRVLVTLLFLISSQVNAETVYVTLEKDNALAVVDPVAGKLLKTVAIGQRPRGIVLSKDRQQLYIATSDDDIIQIIDTQTLKPVGYLPSGEDPETFAINPAGDRLYVSNEDDSLVTVIDIKQAKAIKTIPVGVEPEPVAVSPDEKWVVSASEATNMVHWIKQETLTVEDNTLVDPRPRGLSFSADSQRLWVTSELGGTVTVLDTISHKKIKTIQFSIPGVSDDKIQPVGVIVDNTNQWALVALGPANRVALINAQSLEVEKYFLVGQRVWNLAFSPDQKKVYTTNGVSNDISIIDLDKMKVIRSIAVGRYPWGLVIK
ncbi:PQQ-dependent catabolism-associated beta-propeller protein [methane-oxidizing endosymbiont of Gigantopelta aegis]|uniref:PQQ-dependent catabolism-associated beta-propeller protein n=1 Tax=methane-oxidizing endosymbiont of Gigantopelta aegis TaxID=2794938 RepID=UPI0018DC3865|nr:PQQ-dependent catabolism-associated beta-propeller protein [methane-oxidizing endosymbiont of Gigantopelta aegis]